MAREVYYDPIAGMLRQRDVPSKTGHSGKFLHSDGDDATPADWDSPDGAGTGGDTYVRAYWFAAVASGTTGSLAAPAGGSLVFDAWPEGVDALATELDAGGKPAWETPTQVDGTPVTVALNESGVWTLSGVPSEYPVGIVFCYRTKVADLQDGYTLQETEPEPTAEGVEVILEAGAAVGGQRVVSADAAGAVRHADPADAASVLAVVGISANAADAAGKVRIRTGGKLVDPSWNWTPRAPVFCGTTGLLTQTVPTAGAVLQVGLATSPTMLVVRIGLPVWLA